MYVQNSNLQEGGNIKLNQTTYSVRRAGSRRGAGSDCRTFFLVGGKGGGG